MTSCARVPPGFDTGEYGAGIADADHLLRLDPTAAGSEEAVMVSARGGDRLEQQIRELFAEQTLAESMAGSARLRATRDFAWSQTRDAHLALYRRLIDGC